MTAERTKVPGIALPPQSFERFVILDKKSWDIMGYHGRQHNTMEFNVLGETSRLQS